VFQRFSASLVQVGVVQEDIGVVDFGVDFDDTGQ